MKKVIILFCFLISACLFAIADEPQVDLTVSRSLKIVPKEQQEDQTINTYLILDSPNAIVRISNCRGLKKDSIDIFVENQNNPIYAEASETTVARLKLFKNPEECEKFQEALLDIRSTTKLTFTRSNIIVGLQIFNLKHPMSLQALEVFKTQLAKN